ncbi:MAG: T9SS type A sorting domain-containing protein [Saprospiraceae bacterium]|nr:T9SS type A sorting domain-containing protein [Saprospiraceae bacterium]
MRLCWLTLFAFCWLPAASGQTFVPMPGPLLQQEVEPGLANECYIFLDNPGGDSLRLRWKSVESSFPAGWTIDLCDYGACYTGIPASGTMNTVADTVQAYLKLIVQPNTSPGDAWLWFRVWEDGQATNFQDVFFSLYTPGTTGASAPGSSSLRVFPNPATEFLHLQNEDTQPLPAQLTDVLGRLRWSAILLPQQQVQIAVDTWPAGAYFLQTPGRTQRLLHTR